VWSEYPIHSDMCQRGNERIAELEAQLAAAERENKALLLAARERGKQEHKPFAEFMAFGQIINALRWTPELEAWILTPYVVAFLPEDSREVMRRAKELQARRDAAGEGLPVGEPLSAEDLAALRGARGKEGA